MRLSGKKAFVLGVSSDQGMGGAIVRRLMAEGASVVIAARTEEKAVHAAQLLGTGWTTADLLDEPSLANAMSEVVRQLGGLDIAINLAGKNRSSLISDETAEGLLEQAQVHFIGTALFIREAAAAMPGAGVILTISSLTAELTGARLAAYAGTKAAADKVVQIAALEYGDRGIRVNSIAPGLTRTPMTEAYFANSAIIGAFERETPLGRTASCEDVASAVAWAASDECFSTGDRIRVSGGSHLRRLPTPADFR